MYIITFFAAKFFAILLAISTISDLWGPLTENVKQEGLSLGTRLLPQYIWGPHFTLDSSTTQPAPTRKSWHDALADSWSRAPCPMRAPRAVNRALWTGVPLNFDLSGRWPASERASRINRTNECESNFHDSPMPEWTHQITSEPDIPARYLYSKPTLLWAAPKFSKCLHF
jgi:hypothetical protein